MSLAYYTPKVKDINGKCKHAFTLSGSAFCFFLSVSVFFTSFVMNIIREEKIMFQYNIF